MVRQKKKDHKGLRFCSYNHFFLILHDPYVEPYLSCIKIKAYTKPKNVCSLHFKLDFYFYLIYCFKRHFQRYFRYIMTTSFRCGRCRSVRKEPQTMGKQLLNFSTCGCESSAPFFVIYKAGRKPMPYW